jgi:hypothetical protein
MPAAKAVRLRPVRSASHAWCTAVRADEQAVSTVMLGPRRSKTCDNRLETMELAPPVMVYGPVLSGTVPIRASADDPAQPTKTAVSVPASRSASSPASSSASTAISSSSRCCGSMWAASRGEMPK